VAHYRDQPALIGSAKEACIVRGSLGTGDTVAFPVQHNGRHRNFGLILPPNTALERVTHKIAYALKADSELAPMITIREVDAPDVAINR